MTSMNARSFIAVGCVALGACTTVRVADNFRSGQRVIDATIAEIVSDPKAWNGKWVRVSGVVSSTNQRLYTVEGVAAYPVQMEDHELYLDPAKADPGDERTYGLDPPGSAAQVSGKVRLACWSFWKPFFELVEEAARRDKILLLHPRVPKKIAYCNFVSGPYLERAVIEPLPRSAQ